MTQRPPLHCKNPACDRVILTGNRVIKYCKVCQAAFETGYYTAYNSLYGKMRVMRKKVEVKK